MTHLDLPFTFKGFLASTGLFSVHRWSLSKRTVTERMGAWGSTSRTQRVSRGRRGVP